MRTKREKLKGVKKEGKKNKEIKKEKQIPMFNFINIYFFRFEKTLSPFKYSFVGPG